MLSYSHFDLLVDIDDELKRTFYLLEAMRSNWSVRELKRQIESLYYERSELSLDKTKLAQLTNQSANLEMLGINVKDPYIFEFLGLKPRDVMGESHLEQELINNLDCKPFSLYKILEKAYPNLEVTKISTIFESVMPTKEQSELLMMPINSPLLAANTISKDQNGNFVEYGTSYFRGDTCKIKVDLI